MLSDRFISLALTTAWLLPLAGSVIAWLVGRAAGVRSRMAGWISIGTIAISFAASAAAAWSGWLSQRFTPIAGLYYRIAEFGHLRFDLNYYIDSLTLLMFLVVTLISTCVHVFALGYLDDERTEAYHDHQAETSGHRGIIRPGRQHLFFAFLQFFSFSMLGLVIAGNLLQVFAFWELVGATSYFLIGFYHERNIAAAAATKAFVMNRVGDAGFIIGMMIFLLCGTLTFADVNTAFIGPEGGGIGQNTAGLFSRVADGYFADAQSWWVLGGLCLFAGAVGKSAQLPLSTWLPDAMAGPTPVSALVHSATMVAAGVYLVARVYPLFLPEVLTVIAYVGCVTLFYGAMCALVQTDIKRILAYSTVSQLGYMMLALGVGGREPALFHLVTHAFFKGLLFLTAGSVIVACHHAQDVSKLGGLRRRLPITAATSLVGVIAICGLAVPVFAPFGHPIAFSGYHSKDSILAAALAFVREQPQHGVLFVLPLITAGLTAFYMLRFWLLTFAGEPRDEQLVRHAKEPNWLITGPLVLLSLLAMVVAIGGMEGWLYRAIELSRPNEFVDHTESWHAAHHTAELSGLLAASVGVLLALLVYALGLLDPRKTADVFDPMRRFFLAGWMLDSIYRVLFVMPTRLLAFATAMVDRFLLDGLIVVASRGMLTVARWDRVIDERVIDRLVDRSAIGIFAIGDRLRQLQSGRTRQYVMALGVAVVALFALSVVLMPSS